MSKTFYDYILQACNDLGYSADISLYCTEHELPAHWQQLRAAAKAIARAVCSVHLFDSEITESAGYFGPHDIALNPEKISPVFDNNGYVIALNIRVNSALSIEYFDSTRIKFKYTAKNGKVFTAKFDRAPVSAPLEGYALYGVKGE